MKRALYIIKSIIICICTGIVIGFFVMVTVWAVSKDKPNAAQCLRILRIASAISAFAAALIRLIFAAIDKGPINKALKLSEQGNSFERAESIIKNKISKTSAPDRKNAYRLILSAVYTENSKYNDALNTLERIDFTALSQNLQQEYFNAYMYTYLLKGDIENAGKVYTDAEPYFDKPAPSVLHTLGVFEYAKGNFGKARSFLLQSRSADSSDRNTCDCDLYLALCSLKEGKVSDARALADEAETMLVTYTEEQNLEKLRRLIEKYEASNAQKEETEQDAKEPEITADKSENENENNERIVTDD